MINHVAITSNLDIHVYVHERAEKIVEGIVDKFSLFFSSIKAVSLQLGRGVAK